MKLTRLLPAAVRVALGGIFLYAGILKIADPVGFAGSIAAYQLVPYFLNYLTAAVLPWVELIAGILLITGFKVRAGAVTILLLNLVFIAALASAIVRGLDIDCGCFGAEAQTPPWLALVRDLVFVAMTVYVLRVEARQAERQAEQAPYPGREK